MKIIGLIKEGKTPADNRVALTPAQCKWLMKRHAQLKIVTQHSANRCFKEFEYKRAGVETVDDMSACDILIGIKEVPVHHLLPGKTYLFFSHTKKKQPHNQKMMNAIVQNKITLIDFECLEHEDGQRIIGFGFFAGVVGAHNGMLAYGQRTGTFCLERVYQQKNFQELMHSYFGLKIPNVKIAVTGSGRVAHGILEIMNLMGIIEVEKEEYISREFNYPVYVQLKGGDLYLHKDNGTYDRNDFHNNPQQYINLFENYTDQTDILMNGVYWEPGIPPLFKKEAICSSDFRIQVIADITDDMNGSVPINSGDQTMEHPVYGIDRKTFLKTTPYLPDSIDIMAVSNLPNELPRDASHYFGEQLIKYVLPDLLSGDSSIIEKATIVKEGELTPSYSYLKEYAYGEFDH